MRVGWLQGVVERQRQHAFDPKWFREQASRDNQEVVHSGQVLTGPPLLRPRFVVFQSGFLELSSPLSAHSSLLSPVKSFKQILSENSFEWK